VIEYAVLMWLVARFIRVLFPSQNLAKVLFWAALFSVLYGISDEFHQSFVPYRGARVSDVLIDGVGVILAGAFIFLTSRICQSYRK
jgi:VanZ family protein